MSTFQTVQLQDWHLISKAFEKGASASITEESVFAVLTPQLSTARCMTATVSAQMALNLETSLPSTNSTEEQPAIKFSEVGPVGNLPQGVQEGLKQFGSWFQNECFPCDFRVIFQNELSTKLGVQFHGYIDTIWKMLDSIKKQIMSIIDMLKNVDGYIDLCALIKFLTESICIPDLHRIIAVLMAYLMHLSISLNSIIDIIIGLVAPLIMPFFTNVMDSLQKFIMLAIKPLECIVNSLENIIQKLDYNVLFQNIDQLPNIKLVPTNTSFDPLVQRTNEATSTLGTSLNATREVSIDATGNFDPVANVTLGGQPSPLSNNANFGKALVNRVTGKSIAQTNTEQQSAVDNATKELDQIKAASTSVNYSNPSEVSRYQQQLSAANAKVQEANNRKDTTFVENGRRQVESFRNSMKSRIFQLIGYLRNIAAIFDNLINVFFDEFKKLVGDYFGGGSDFIISLKDKLAIVQIISLVKAIIQALQNGTKCNEEGKEVDTFISTIPRDKGINIRTDSDGTVHIEQSDSAIDGPLAALVGIQGSNPNTNFANPSSFTLNNGVGAPTSLGSNDGTFNNIPSTLGSNANNINQNIGSNNSNSIRNKFKSLIPVTGNPTLDSDISKIVEALTNPVKVKFKCPLQTSVSQAEQVNRWIAELNT